MTSAQFPPHIPILLDGRPVEKITAFLFPNGGNDDPQKLRANEGKSFQGSIVLGMGFTFDDTNPEATPIAEMHRLIEENPKNAEVIFPYIGGEEVNSSPTHAHHRYVINFGEMSEKEVRENYPDLIAIVEEKVKPERDKLGNNPDARRRKNNWWLWGRYTPALFRAIAESVGAASPQENRVLVISRVNPNCTFSFVPAKMVYAESLVVFALHQNATIAILQGRSHEIWARFFSSTAMDLLRYSSSDAFETFPFPEAWETNPTLEEVGKTYYEYRADLMVRNNQGLTDTYNRFHDPDERDPDILKLRELHDQMDRAVLDAYGWSDIWERSRTPCGFALDYLDIETDELPTEVQDRIASGDLFFPTADEASTFDSLVRTGKRKLPWRYRWPEATHDEVLARLLDLNQKRYDEEVLGGKQAEGKQKKTTKKSAKSKKPDNTPLFPGLSL